jgi:ketosteroid isomerase-like protein
MTQKNKATLLLANEAISQGDHEGFLKHCTEDTHWHFLGDKVLSGKEEVRNWMKEAYLEPPVFEVINLIGEGDFVTAIGTISLKDAEGNTTHSSYCDVWRFQNGKMAALCAFVVEASGEIDGGTLQKLVGNQENQVKEDAVVHDLRLPLDETF